MEVHTPRGRVDIVILIKTDLYLMELKLNQDAQTVMQQIDFKNYCQRFALSGKPITKVGINFDEKTGNITDWMTERLLSDVLWHEICLLLIQWLTSRPWDFLSGGNRSRYGDDRV